MMKKVKKSKGQSRRFHIALRNKGVNSNHGGVEGGVKVEIESYNWKKAVDEKFIIRVDEDPVTHELRCNIVIPSGWDTKINKAALAALVAKRLEE